MFITSWSSSLWIFLFPHHQLKRKKKSYESFQKNSNCLDDFYEKEVEVSNFKVLSSVVKLVLALSHGQAKVEREFNMNTKVLKVNLKEVSITSRQLIIDYISSQNPVLQLFLITKSLLKSVCYSRQRYERESARKQHAQCAKLAIIDKEIEEHLDTEFLQLADVAEK